MEDIIRFALSNFTLTFFVLGLITAAVSLAQRKERPLRAATIADTVLAHFLLLSVGVSFLYNFVMHVFFSTMAAKFIGWENSPFQLEVGYASLGFAVVGLLAFRGDAGMRLAAIVGPACFLWGAAIGHIHQIIVAHNYASGNAGIILYSDILLPIVGFALYWYWRRVARSELLRPRHSPT